MSPLDAAAHGHRARIGQALVELAAGHSYEEITTAMIAAAAGLRPAEVEACFATKQECFAGVWQDLSDELLSRLWSAMVNGTDWREGLRAAAHVALGFFTEDPERSRFFLVEVLEANEMARARRDLLFQEAVELVDLGRRELEDPEALSRDRAEAVLGAIYERINSAFANGELAGDAGLEAVRQMMYVAVLPYAGQAAASEELELPAPAWVAPPAPS